MVKMGLYEEINVANWPEFAMVKQQFPRPRVENVEKEIFKQFQHLNLQKKMGKGAKIAVAVGSRGIKDIEKTVSAVIKYLKRIGAEPFIVPAMGSHGGACEQGQMNILAGFGITPEKMGVYFDPDMSVDKIAATFRGLPVYFSRAALKADGIVLINRIKLHTNFRGKYESGLLKMLAVGLGKHKGALTLHSLGFENMGQNIIDVGSLLLKKINVLFGVAIVENAYDETAKIVIVPGEKILDIEPDILQYAKSLMARIPFKRIDVLVIREMGKNISGDGIDTNVIGRYSSQLIPDYNMVPEINSIAVLDLTEHSYGCAIGIGYADVVARRLVDKIDYEATYTNAITATAPISCKIPIIMKNDRLALETALKLSRIRYVEKAKIVIIKNTLELGEMYASQELIEETKDLPEITIISALQKIKFDEEGNLAF